MICLYESKGNCCGCTACMNSCPHNAIAMKLDEEGFLYPQIDTNFCVECGICVKVCPFHKSEHENLIPEGQEVYALKHPEDEVRRRSSSGGAFTAISDYILENNGIIYGAIFDDNFDVVHGKAWTIDQRNKMRGSKYTQSRLGNIFRDIKATLKEGRLVLFTGTPCQNGGLKSYLGKEYDNLILCDIACHGVPSPKIWSDYKKYLENRYKDKITEVTFRSKDSGWNNSSLKVSFEQKEHIKSMQEDPFYILFFSHLSLRPACHQCVYASYHRVTDLTLADFWGIEKSEKTFTDKLGISLILVNTKKGKELFDKISGNFDIIKSNHEACYQPIFEAPSRVSPRRSEFWKEYLEAENGGTVIEKYGRLSVTQKLIKKVIVPVLKITGLYQIVAKVYFKP
jgi:coenzyme F420-reducing hydrogenase beta subunit